jgi:hypothetical protein
MLEEKEKEALKIMRKIVQCSACNGANTSLMCGESKKLSISAVGKF